SAAFTWTAGSWISARRIGETGPRRLVIVGLGIVVLGVGAMTTVVATSIPVWLAVPAWMVGGLGIGLAYAPLSQAALAAAEPGRMGAASSSLQLSDVLGVAVGTGIGGALVAVADRHDVTVDGSTVLAGVLMAWGLAALVGAAGMRVAKGVPAQLS